MSGLIGIRREDKNAWEKRTPLVPNHVSELKKKFHIDTLVQPSPIRAFTNDEYLAAGVQISNELQSCKIIFAVKEIPSELLLPLKTFLYFSHTIKGQPRNMPMLKRLLELRCNLIDYECITNADNQRLVFFGRYAGLAGMVDTLHAIGKRLQAHGYDTPFKKITLCYQYHNLAEAMERVREVGNIIEKQGLPDAVLPLVVGFAGYGRVSKGAQEIFDLLPVHEISPNELLTDLDPAKIYKVVFHEKDMFELKKTGSEFDLQDYYAHPEFYKSRFEEYLPHLSVLVNGIYWDSRYPRLVTKKYLKSAFSKKHLPRLQIIADISCDINGSIECTEKITEPDDPVYVYNPLTDSIKNGYDGNGVAILAVDNLPAELPRDASESFSRALLPFIPHIVAADFTVPLNKCQLPPEIKGAVIACNGALTPKYDYLYSNLDKI